MGNIIIFFFLYFFFSLWIFDLEDYKKYYINYFIIDYTTQRSSDNYYSEITS